jgi:hypothetical protein
MGLPSYMRSVIDRNVVMRSIPVRVLARGISAASDLTRYLYRAS